jgi:hypothetical protein
MKVNVWRAVMLVRMEMPVFPQDRCRQRYPQPDQEQTDPEFHEECEPVRNHNVEQEDQRSDDQQHRRVSEPPAEPDQAGYTQVRMTGQQSGHRDEMIRVEGMSRAQHESDGQEGNEL